MDSTVTSLASGFLSIIAIGMGVLLMLGVLARFQRQAADEKKKRNHGQSEDQQILEELQAEAMAAHLSAEDELDLLTKKILGEVTEAKTAPPPKPAQSPDDDDDDDDDYDEAAPAQETGSAEGEGVAASEESAPRYAILLPNLFPVPPATRHFVGHRHILEKLASTLSKKISGGAILSSFDGAAGYGCTSIAEYFAFDEKVREHFTHGIHMISANREEGAGPALDATEMLQMLLRMFVGDAELPETRPDLQTMWRDATRGKRMLLIVDGIETAEQVVPLLTSHNSCKLLFTAMKPLQVSDIPTIRVEPLHDSEATASFLAFANRKKRGRLTEGDAKRISAMTAKQPLSNRIVAAHFDAERHFNAQSIMDRYNDELKRLQNETLSNKELVAALMLFKRATDPALPQLWSKLSVFTGGFAFDAVKTVIGGGNLEAMLQELIRRNVLWSSGPKRYWMHPFLRNFARQELKRAKGESDKLYLKHAQYYTDRLNGIINMAGGPETFTGDSIAKLFEDYNNYLSAQDWCAGQLQIDDKAAKLAYLFPQSAFIQRILPSTRLAKWLNSAIMAATRLKDTAAIAHLQGSLAHLCERQGKPEDAIEAFKRQTNCHDRMKNLDGILEGLENISRIYTAQGNQAKVQEIQNRIKRVQSVGSLEGAPL